VTATEIIHQHFRLPETGFIRLPVVLSVFPVSRSAWWDGVKSGRFPQAVKLGPRVTAWRVEDIRKLIESIGQEQPA
jgi:prophage regulatory protein